MSAFKVGDVVRSKVDSQRLQKGEVYEVHSVATLRNFTGGYTIYGLKRVSDGERVSNVCNGHLLLERVS